MRPGENYGPYMIATGLPLPYYEPSAGLLDLWHMPAQWDESETLGLPTQLGQSTAPDWPGLQAVPPEYHGFYAPLAPEVIEGMVGLTAEDYGTELVRFAQDAAQRWHGVQIANFHPRSTWRATRTIPVLLGLPWSWACAVLRQPAVSLTTSSAGHVSFEPVPVYNWSCGGWATTTNS